MFTPIETTVGALLLHQATRNLLFQNGDILGASGFLRRLFSAPTKELIGFFAGMAFSYVPLNALAPQLVTSYPSALLTPQAAVFTVALGALIGWGTKASNGCTSGHMLCGLSRLSGRSAVVVATFFPVASVTHHLAHPTLRTEACPGDLPCYTPVYPSSTATASLILLAALSVFAARTVPSLVARSTISQTERKNKSPHTNSRSAPRIATTFFSGLLFALGLHISGMSHPAKVASFLSFPVLEHWDPSLALIILFGVLPNLVENQKRGFISPPKFASQFSLPTKTLKDVDAKFVLGAAAFGIGWGLSGTCPGPAVLRALAQPAWGVLWMGGFWLGGRIMS
ncbi:YeeE/YedE family integral membrane protein-like protein [Plenodomus tracheiphilus IPT5]|uniref:YeeE/YedE family integral membrane protein-like protein n=1 Tax=Plenodomus tracheiphilus IPT5 TaxID=1408161 RepID=A0A6A7B3G3_9PLEO|nr:YeeE/YedE family integral membrane protein-like protein [Plenodomus tracheiphilus IPT5]